MPRRLRLPILLASLMLTASACGGAERTPFAEPLTSFPSTTTVAPTTTTVIITTTTVGSALPATPVALAGSGECTDPAGDLASDPSGFAPPIPWAGSDIVAARAGLADGVLGFVVEMPMAADPAAGGMITGGPGPIPLQFDALIAGDPWSYKFQLYRALDEQQADTTVYMTKVQTVNGEVQTIADMVPVGQSQVEGWRLYAAVDATLVDGLVPGDWTLDFKSTWGPVYPLGVDTTPEPILDYGCADGTVFRVLG